MSELKSHKKAFVLLVHLEFANPADTQAFLEAFAPLAQHCRDFEPNTLTYEAAVDDQTGTKIVIMER